MTSQPWHTESNTPVQLSQLNPQEFQAVFQHALRLHQQGRLTEAQHHYESLLQQQSNHSDTLYLLGMVHFESDRLPEAQALLEAALQEQPNHIEALTALSQVYWASQNTNMTEIILQKLLALTASPDIALQLAKLGMETQNHRLAIEGYQLYIEQGTASLTEQAEQETAFLALGSLLSQEGRYSEALQALHNACQLNPREPERHAQLGHLYLQQGQPKQALACYHVAEQTHPDAPTLAYNQGVAHWELNETEAAIGYFEKAIALNPSYSQAWNALGQAYQQMNQAEKAVYAFQQVEQLSPSLATDIRSALALPCLFESADQCQQWATRYLKETQRITQKPISAQAAFDPLSQVNYTPFYSAYLGLDEKATQTQWGQYYAQMDWVCEDLKKHPVSFKTKRSKPRIAFLSKHFHSQHTIGILNAGLFQHLDRTQLEVFVCHTDDLRTRKSPLIDPSHPEFVWIPSHNLDAASEAIRALDVDFLFYTDIGMDAFSYFLSMRRLAPIQLTTWGHPITTGAPSIDYYLAFDAALASVSEDGFSETLISLPKSLVCVPQPPKCQTVSREAYGLSASQTLYLCSQSLFKIHPMMDPLFAGILAGDPQAKLLFLEGNNPSWQATLRQRWQHSLPEEAQARIQFLPRVTPEAFPAVQAMADVLLDTFPFAGGLTSLEAMATGTPIVTLASNQLKGNITSAWYREMGLSHLISENMEAAIQQALKLGSNATYRKSVQEEILQNQSVLFNQTQGIRALETWLLSEYERRGQS